MPELMCPIKTFTGEEGFQVTPIMFDGKPIFIPLEFEDQLGYSNLSNTVLTSVGFIKDFDYTVLNNDKLKSLKELLRSTYNAHSPQQLYEAIKLAPSLLVLTESGLYGLMFRSNKEICMKFRFWVTSKVLPELRTTGKYITKNDEPKQLTVNQKLQLIAEEFQEIKEIEKIFKSTRNKSLLAANTATMQKYGINFMQNMQIELARKKQLKIKAAAKISTKEEITAKIAAILEVTPSVSWKNTVAMIGLSYRRDKKIVNELKIFFDDYRLKLLINKKVAAIVALGQQGPIVRRTINQRLNLYRGIANVTREQIWQIAEKTLKRTIA